jgi:signal transduction histidine kinase
MDTHTPVRPEKGSQDNPEHNNMDSWFRITGWLLHVKVTTGIRSIHFFIISGLFIVLTYIYYGVITAYHDIYIILFFYPLIYAAIVYRLRGVIISGLVFLAVLLPHAFLMAEDMIYLARSLIFALFAFLISSLGATLMNHLGHQMEAYREIMALNKELNTYIERLQNAQQQLIQAAKLTSLGQLAASVAHELNNPIAGILVYTKLVKDKLSGDDIDRERIRNNLEKVESAVDYCTGIIRGLLDFARQSPPHLRPVTVNRAIDTAVSLVNHQAKSKNIEIIREETPELPLVVADFNQLIQVFVNLAVNAFQAMADGSKLTIRSSVNDDGRVMISFRDTGYGIPPENMEKLFTPFFTTKDEVKGVGLGLAISHGIIERHGGSIEVESEVGKGSTFTIILPAYIEESPSGM